MTDATTPAPVRDTTDMPLRLRAAAQAVADNHRAGAGFDRADLDTVSDLSFERYVTLARTVLDAADTVDIDLGTPLTRTVAAIERIAQAKAATTALRAQGVVLIDIAQDGSVRVSTWTAAAGTAAEALAEWGAASSSTRSLPSPSAPSSAWAGAASPPRSPPKNAPR